MVADQVALQKCPVIIIIIVGIATDTIMLLAHNYTHRSPDTEQSL